MSQGSRFDAKQIICTVIGGVFIVGLIFLVALHLGKSMWSSPSLTPSAEAQPDFAAAAVNAGPELEYGFFAMLDAPAPQRPLPELALPINPALDPNFKKKQAAAAAAAGNAPTLVATADPSSKATDAALAGNNKSKADKADKPKADKPKADKPKADKPKADKPKADKKSKDEAASVAASSAGGVDALLLASAVSKPKHDEDRKDDAAEPAKKSSKSGRFTVQVSAFQDSSVAEGLVKSLAAQGYDAQVKAEDVPGRGMWYRVRVGHYESREDADKAKSQLAKKSGYDGFVTAP